ncbi:MAG: NAD(P)-binding protein, partial [Porticoccaceae bacterium]|nr:NAD(P)-binding protein [Porticoccaceae bacterium]
MHEYDNIIIGGGHNGLICATYLARKGQSVLLLEASNTLGGLAASREFAPDFRVSVAHSLSHFSEAVSKELRLTDHGYSPCGEILDTVGLSLDGQHVVVSGDQISGVNASDKDNYGSYLATLKRFAGALKPFWM